MKWLNALSPFLFTFKTIKYMIKLEKGIKYNPYVYHVSPAISDNIRDLIDVINQLKERIEYLEDYLKINEFDE
jgi:hypothetical protein